jgi:hypothetical protein
MHTILEYRCNLIIDVIEFAVCHGNNAQDVPEFGHENGVDDVLELFYG